MNVHWKLNTSNVGKLEEFKTLFSKFGATVDSTQIDLKEIEASPLQVVAHKASQVPERVLVEDTSLNIEDADVGINVRWLLDHLPNFLNKKAHWQVLLAYRVGDEVYVYRGDLLGKIVSRQGTGGFGFDPFFLPDGADLTLAQAKPDKFNARFLAVEALVCEKPFTTVPAIYDWKGAWQKD